MRERFSTLVVGGSGALGREVCQILAAQGSRVAFTSHQGEAIAGQLREKLPGALARQLDVTSVPALERTIDEAANELGGLDAFVHCAAICMSPGDSVPVNAVQRMEDVHEAGWDALLAVNLKSAFFACRHVARHLRARGGGNLVLLGSLDAVKPTPSPVAYATSKGALVAMTQTMAKELGRDNIRVNLVAPGVMEAGVSHTLPAALRDEYVKHCGLKRVGRLVEVAHVVAWLARHNTYVSGQTILVDGAL